MLSSLRKVAFPIFLSVLAPASVAAASLASTRAEIPTGCEFFCGCASGPAWCCTITVIDEYGVPILEVLCDTFFEIPEG